MLGANLDGVRPARGDLACPGGPQHSGQGLQPKVVEEHQEAGSGPDVGEPASPVAGILAPAALETPDPLQKHTINQIQTLKSVKPYIIFMLSNR